MFNLNKKNKSNLIKSRFFSEIDLYFADFISRCSKNYDPEVFWAAALASRATGDGHICFDLTSYAETVIAPKLTNGDIVQCPSLERWREKLLACPAVGRPGELCPLILDERHRLYLYRYWKYEKEVADFIKTRIRENIIDIDLQNIRSNIRRLFPESQNQAINWQKIAAVLPLLKKISIITGAPGTGKTYTIAKALALLIGHARPYPPGILMAAPTGKAAVRLSESMAVAKQTLACDDGIKNLIPQEVYTVHRLLKPVPGSPYFHYNITNPLPADVVVLDEASMVDLALMSKLIQAIAVKARFILVGDKDQLASVESGSVLGDMCDRDIIHGFSRNFADRIEELTGEKISKSIPLTGAASAMQDCIVILQKNYRFSADSGIGGLSRDINRGEAEESMRLMQDFNEKSIGWQEIGAQTEWIRALGERIADSFRRYMRIKERALALEEFDRFKILCALKIGPFGVREINRFAEEVLRQRHLIPSNPQPDNPWYNGRPVMITRNDYHLGLFNGDIGIAMADTEFDNGELAVFFPADAGKVKKFSPYRLPEHETAFAMTVHKSQGSEFDEVILILPDRDYPVLTRELLYTGITRAKKKASVWGTESVWRAAVRRRIERTSGLRDALWR
jgi:exodeoxyribonuclease V alpha subunit